MTSAFEQTLLESSAGFGKPRKSNSPDKQNEQFSFHRKAAAASRMTAVHRALLLPPRGAKIRGVGSFHSLPRRLDMLPPRGISRPPRPLIVLERLRCRRIMVEPEKAAVTPRAAQVTHRRTHPNPPSFFFVFFSVAAATVGRLPADSRGPISFGQGQMRQKTARKLIRAIRTYRRVLAAVPNGEPAD